MLIGTRRLSTLNNNRTPEISSEALARQLRVSCEGKDEQTERAPVVSGVDCEREGPDLVSCVAIGSDAVCTNHDRIHLALRHERGRRRVGYQRCRQPVVH